MSQSALRSRVNTQDHLVRETVDRTLADSGYTPLRCIQFDVHEGVVELSGCVPSFYLKQLAQSAVLRLEQIRGVRNLLRVA
jgi:osmotically-inducible protein OsmY